MTDLNTTPRTWTASEVVTASMMNAEIRDALTALQSAWTSYSPTYGNFTAGNATAVAKYRRVGKTIQFRFTFTVGSTSSFSGQLVISLPVAMASDYTPGASVIGRALLVDTSVGNSSRSTGVAFVNSLTNSNVSIVADRAASGAIAASTVTNTAPWTWATGDTFSISGEYEAA